MAYEPGELEHLVSIGDRAATTIAPQALALMNSSHVREYANAFARRIRPSADVTLDDAVHSAWSIALAREPDQSEVNSAINFIRSQAKQHESTQDPLQSAVTDFCQVLMSSNEFLYLP